MSRNLTTSFCVHCGKQVRLEHIRGQPLEIRRYSVGAPSFGTKWTCDCGIVYFVIIRTNDTHWGEELIGQADNDVIRYAGRTWPNEHKGKFYTESNDGRRFETGTFTLDLPYWHTFNDERTSPQEEDRIEQFNDPWHLCKDNAEDVELVWGDAESALGRGDYDLTDEGS